MTTNDLRKLAAGLTHWVERLREHVVTRTWTNTCTVAEAHEIKSIADPLCTAALQLADDLDAANSKLRAADAMAAAVDYMVAIRHLQTRTVLTDRRELYCDVFSYEEIQKLLGLQETVAGIVAEYRGVGLIGLLQEQLDAARAEIERLKEALNKPTESQS